MQRLIACPKLTVRLLRERLQLAEVGEPQRLGHLFADLDSRQFAVRERATQELEKLGQPAEAELRRMLGRPGLSAEFRRRAEHILDKVQIPRGAALQQLRAVEVLERIGTPEAQVVLGRLSAGAPAAKTTHEAKTALARLSKRSVPD
jgi:hypothetical protein